MFQLDNYATIVEGRCTDTNTHRHTHTLLCAHKYIQPPPRSLLCAQPTPCPDFHDKNMPGLPTAAQLPTPRHCHTSTACLSALPQPRTASPRHRAQNTRSTSTLPSPTAQHGSQGWVPPRQADCVCVCVHGKVRAGEQQLLLTH